MIECQGGNPEICMEIALGSLANSWATEWWLRLLKVWEKVCEAETEQKCQALNSIGKMLDLG